MQLVEQGSIPLDDAEFIKKIAPEIGAKKVCADGVNGVDQQDSVTMRMLLSHTAGFAYAFFDPRVGMQGRPIGIDGKSRSYHSAESMFEYCTARNEQRRYTQSVDLWHMFRTEII